MDVAVVVDSAARRGDPPRPPGPGGHPARPAACPGAPRGVPWLHSVGPRRRGRPRLCGRDPSGLDAKELSRAVVESVAENTSDGVVAPLLWGAVAGLPGFLAYRAINTLDSMVGYRSPEYARFGWASARLDDVVNWAPARLTGILAGVLAPAIAGRPALSWR